MHVNSKPLAGLPESLVDAPRVPRESGPKSFEASLERVTSGAGPARMEGTRGAVRGEPALVRAERTRLTGSQAAEALASAWEDRVGSPPSERTLSILVAHWAHETGRGESMLNYNFGGIKGTGPSGLSAAYRTREGFGEHEVRITDRFRAYTSAEEGARDYVDLLVRRYDEAVQRAANEDPEGFVRSLRAKGYFTGEEQAYVRSVMSLANQALARGFDAIGASPAEPAAATELARNGASTATLGARPPPFAPRGNSALLPPERATVASVGTTAEPSLARSWNALAFADEVSRAALVIAARQGAPDREERG